MQAQQTRAQVVRRRRPLAWRAGWVGLVLLLLLAASRAPNGSAAQAQTLILTQQTNSVALAIGVYRPEFPDDLDSVETYEQGAGAGIDLIHWYALWGGWKRSFNRADLEAVRRRGSLPVITWEPWSGVPEDAAWSLRAAVLSGASDTYVRSWARGLAEYQGPVLLRFAHEMHDHSYPWAVGVNGNTAEDYVRAWRHVHALFVEAGATNVRWIWNPNTMPGASRAQYEQVYRALYPGDDVVDWVGLDVYNGGPRLSGWGGWRTFADELGEPYAAVRAVSDKPVFLAEVGSAESSPGAKADWIRDAFATLAVGQFPAVRALVWFDVDKEENWALHSSSDALSAWLGAIGAQRPAPLHDA